MASSSSLSKEHKALVFYSIDKPLQIEIRPVPTVTSGSAIVRILSATVMSYSKAILTGQRNYDYPTPFTPGVGAVGRIAAVGPDATALKPGDLVAVDIFVRGRDNDDARCLFGLHQGGSEGSARLVEGEWRHGTYAEYAKVPLENCRLLPQDGRSVHEWLSLFRMLVPFGGLTHEGGVDLKPGERVVIAPATGQFSGSGVEVALAMGATVVALGRNADTLQKMQDGMAEYGSRLRTVRMTGDVDADAQAIGPVDCYLDLSPPAAGNSTHIKSCFEALKPRGRVCFMGGIQHDVSIPHGKIYRQGITITGKWMYERKSVRDLINMVEAGLVKLDRSEYQIFALEEWEKALDVAAQKSTWGWVTAMAPTDVAKA